MLLLHPTSMQNYYSCFEPVVMFVTVVLDHQPCLLKYHATSTCVLSETLHLTYNHVCYTCTYTSNNGWYSYNEPAPEVLSLTVLTATSNVLKFTSKFDCCSCTHPAVKMVTNICKLLIIYVYHLGRHLEFFSTWENNNSMPIRFSKYSHY